MILFVIVLNYYINLMSYILNVVIVKRTGNDLKHFMLCYTMMLFFITEGLLCIHSSTYKNWVLDAANFFISLDSILSYISSILILLSFVGITQKIKYDFLNSVHRPNSKL